MIGIVKNPGMIDTNGFLFDMVAGNRVNGIPQDCTVTVNNADHSDAGLPGTGDSSNMMLWVALLFVSGGILGAVTYRKKRKSK